MSAAVMPPAPAPAPVPARSGEPAAPAGYALLERLGEGASGVVYKARQHSTGQWVAIKFLNASPGADAATRERRRARFARETRLCAQLHHPHIVRLLDQGQTEREELFAVFEFVPGQTLRDLLLHHGPLSAPQAGELMGQVLDALVEAHAQGIVHRDLKPLNIMVTRRGERMHAKVLDFGIGTLAAELGAAASGELTLSAETVGTPRYSAPEQLRGEPPTVKSDLYAWGLMLVECLTGSPAVRGQTLAEVYHEHLSPNELPLPTGLLGHPLGELLRRVLSKQARERGDAAGAYARLRELPLHQLVGRLAPESGDLDVTATAVAPLAAERRQITMLAFSLELAATGAAAPSDAALEAMEELLSDQLAQCQDVCLAFGAHLAGALGGMRLAYFGYPQASDSAARRAASAALELVTRIAQRGRRIETRAAVRLELRVALHAGVMLVRPGQVPTGLAAGVVERLLQSTAPGHIAVSDRARHLLERHCLLEEAPGLALAQEDGQAAPAWYLCAERRADGPAGPGPQHAPLVGRGRESAALAGLWRRVAGGRGGALLLVGEPGMGKSRLVQALCDGVSDEHGRAWVVQCLPEQRHSALYPFLRWLSTQLGLHEAADPGARLQLELDRLEVGGAQAGAILASWLGLPLPPQSEALQHAPQRQRGIVLQALQALLGAMARGPAILVVEDVHWADPTSRELIERLLADGGRPGLGVVLTSRPESDFRPAVETLRLQGLAAPEAQELLRHWPGLQGLPGADIARLAARADGNPLFLTELARAWLDPRTGTGGGATPSIPPSLQEVLAQALDRLGPAKETAQLAAAIGREFEPALLAQISERDEAAVDSDLEQLFLADLVERQRRVQGEAYVFRHALVRDAAYDSLPRQARTQAHERIALVLEEQPGCAPGTLARHLALAGRFERAVPHGLRAVSESLARAQYEEAQGQIEALRPWVAELAPEPARTAAELDLTLLETHALMSSLGWADPRVRAAAEHADALLDRQGAAQGDPVQRAAALWALGTFHHVAGERERVRELAAQLVGLAQGCPETVSLQRAAYTLQGVGQWIDGSYAQAARTLELVAALPRAEGTEDAARFGLDCRCWSLASLANVRWFLDDDREAALALAQSAVAEAEALGHMPTLGLCLMYLGMLHQHGEDRASAAQACERLLALSSRYGLPAVEAYGLLVNCWARDDEATLAAILERLDAMGCLLGQTYFKSLRADIALRARDAARAAALLDGCVAQAERGGERYFMPELLRRGALVLLELGGEDAPVQAQALLLRACRMAQDMGMRFSEREIRRQIGALPAPGLEMA
ncbi:TOMM system kinase/cyclase fusion protein [Azohydromonas caseinilytica]|uniref:TOMM system kinase/cyclase fusion protein n=1 Tax=Azohydromonas caseinilytica TaxID=2728836 RepID=A0A848FD42_9BURK|nr:TOMM system kinase/cyclase fusion protein [Azohydromonas caseinilytica]NML16906.1 TOMM system kinase/cyclase fusion protein [Azohydromonas caseinilytica]